MTILQALIQLRDDIKLWCINNFNAKLNKNLGTEESGKFLSVDENGDIGTVDINTALDSYETKTDASSKLSEAKTYTDSVASGKSDAIHTHTMSDITDGTLSSDRLPTVPISKGGTGATTAEAALANLGVEATASELNYVRGATSNIQTQLNDKASISHTHDEKYYTEPEVDALIEANKPKIATITLSASAWTGSANPWSQSISINGVTENSKIDLQPTAAQIVALQASEITLMIENDNGAITAWAMGNNRPVEDYTLQALITEVIVDG